MSVTITFLGAAGTVTGSTYLVSHGTTKILVDCGIFQGERAWRERNWNQPPFNPSEISAVLLTHAHVDHIGMLPRYYTMGLRCPVYCSPATAELAGLLLLDSGRLQEEEASYRRERGRSRHTPPLPLYTEQQARESLQLLRPTQINSEHTITDSIRARWSLMGHILGACSITLNIGGKKIVFSGDIGRYGEPVLVDPNPVEMGDLLVIESTYGDRLHNRSRDVHDLLAEVINRTTKRGGTVLIPSFAVGRTQTLLYYLRELKDAKRIPDIPVIIDSPMASDATEIYQRHTNEYDAAAMALLRKGFKPFQLPKIYFIRDREESIKLNSIHDPMILISASGMLSGGRILHHLKHRVSDKHNTILFVGFQPPGSRGDWLKRGARSIRIMAEEVAVHAEMAEISGLSAHADRDELLRWCRSCSGTPTRVAVVHGEPESARAFSETLQVELGWNTMIPSYLETLELP
jgi:metallo-beta-lactamase family protein